MMREKLRSCGQIVSRLAIISCGLIPTGVAWTQQVQVQTPLQGGTTGFYEQTGVSWNFRRGNFYAEWPGGNVSPPFGGPDPGALAQLGGQFRGPGGGQGSFRITAGQGSTTTNSLAGSTLTLPNGGFGFVNSIQISPFVTGIVPVVNDGFVVPTMSPVQERIARLALEGMPPEPQPPRKRYDESAAAAMPESSATQADIGLRDIEQSLAREDLRRRSELLSILEKARRLEESKPAVARYYYQLARRRAPAEMINEIDQSLMRVERKRQAERSTTSPSPKKP